MDLPQITAQSCLLFEPRLGYVLFTQNDTQRCQPASVTKLWLARLVAEYLPLDLILTMTTADRASGSLAGLVVGETIAVGDGLYGLFLESGNELANMFANALGQRILGKLAGATAIAGGVAMMNDLASALGCTDSHFIDPHGNNASTSHYTSANDLMIAALEAYAQPALAAAMACNVYTLGAHKWVNQNINVGQYPGARGAKEGYTPTLGYSLAMVSERGGHQLVTCQLRQPAAVFQTARQLHDYGYWLLGETAEAESTIEETQGSVAVPWTYVGSWGTSAYSDAYSGGYCKYSQRPGDSATCSPVGSFTGFSWIAPRGPTRGTATVQVDAMVPVTVVAKDAVFQAKQELFRIDGLAYGQHTVVITVASGLVEIDAARIRAHV